MALDTTVASLFGIVEGLKFGAVDISGSIREVHSMTAEVTSNVVETGSDLADHKLYHPAEIQIDGIISNIRNSIREELSMMDAPTAKEAYDTLVQMFKSAEVFEVVTGFQRYPNMVFVSLVVNRDQSTGEVVNFSATLRQIEFADSGVSLVAPPPAEAPKLQEKKNAGPKKPSPVAEIAKKPVSVLKGLVSSAKSAVGL